MEDFGQECIVIHWAFTQKKKRDGQNTDFKARPGKMISGKGWDLISEPKLTLGRKGPTSLLQKLEGGVYSAPNF